MRAANRHLKIAAIGLAALTAGALGCQDEKCKRGDPCDESCAAPEVPTCVVDGICRCQPPGALPDGGTPTGDGGGSGGTGTGGTGVMPSACVAPAPGELILNEILFKGVGENSADEFVELVNASDHAVGLGGVRIYSVSTAGNETDRYVFSAGCIAPHAAAVFFHLQDLSTATCSTPFVEMPATSKKPSATKYADTGDLDYRMSGTSGPLGQFAGARSDIDDGPGESVNRSQDGAESPLTHHVAVSPARLKSSPGLCANGGTFEAACADALPAADGGAMGGDGGGHPTDGGMPMGDGGGGPMCALAAASPPVAINEVLANAAGSSESHAEFIELVNTTAADYVLDGHSLWIGASAASVAEKLRFGTGTLPAHGAVAVFGNNPVDQWTWDPAPAVPATVASESFGIVNSGNPLVVELRDAAGTPVDHVEIDDSLSDVDGVSANRCADVTGTTFDLHTHVGATPTSPAHCANGGRFIEGCVAPAPGSMP